MPKIVDKKAKRKEIARLAIDLFADKGFEKTSIREITATAGMGKGTFYDYFSDKEDILTEIVYLSFEEWTGMIVKKLEGVTDSVERMTVLLKEGAKLGQDTPKLMITYVDIWRRAVTQKETGDFIKSFKFFLLESKKTIARVVEKAKRENKIHTDVEASEIASIILALIDGLCLHHMILKDELDVDLVGDSFINVLKEG